MPDEKGNKQRKKFLVFYYPSKWSSLKRFYEFNYSEYTINSQTLSLLRSIEFRFEKTHLLWNLFNKIRKIQPEEQRIVEKEGFVNPIHSKLMAAIFEAILNEFYSINDNIVKVLRNIFPKENLPETMSKLITGVRKKKYTLPGPLNEIVSDYASYQSLNNIRTESSHFSSGLIAPGNTLCYFSDKSGPTTKSNGNAILIDDVGKFYTNQLNEISSFVDRIFVYLESTLTNNDRRIRICGIYKNLLYQRLEGYMDWKTGHEGVCKPIWEENTEVDACPLAKSCKAYANYLLEKR